MFTRTKVIKSGSKHIQLKKYGILKDYYKRDDDKTVHRIIALKSFKGPYGTIIHKGTLGGWVEGYHNLSQDGSCWIYNEGICRDSAAVYDNAAVTGSAKVTDYASVLNSASIGDNARLRGYANISGNAEIFGNANICSAEITDNSIVCGNIVITNDAKITGKSHIRENAYIDGPVLIDSATVTGHANILGDTIIKSGIIIDGDACIIRNQDYCIFYPVIINPDINPVQLTFYKVKDGSIDYNVSVHNKAVEYDSAVIEYYRNIASEIIYKD